MAHKWHLKVVLPDNFKSLRKICFLDLESIQILIKILSRNHMEGKVNAIIGNKPNVYNLTKLWQATSTPKIQKIIFIRLVLSAVDMYRI